MRILFAILALILFSQFLHAQQNHRFPSFENAPLSEVISYLETNFDLIFSYRDSNLEAEFVSTPQGEYELQTFLDKMFRQTRLDFEFIDERYVILTKKEKQDISKGFLCGYIRDKESEQLLPFANILVKGKNTGINSTARGQFELLNIEPGDTLLVSYIGYHKLQVVIADQKWTDCPTFYLERQKFEIPEVVVTVYLTDGILQASKAQQILIKPKKLSIYPGAVEPDIMTSIQMLPGIFSADETASGLNIRGGTPDQNLVLWDDIPVYHTGHFFGMISAFNPYIVDNVNVYRSGMGTEYGGRVSGVIDIQSSDEPVDTFNLGVGMNMTHGHLNTQIPLWKKSSMTLSLRRSFTDFWATPTFTSFAEKVFQGTKLTDDSVPDDRFEPKDNFYFTDFNFKWVWTPGKNRFGIDLFSGFNNLDYTSQLPNFPGISKDLVQLENLGSRLYWARDWSKKFSSKISLTSSGYDYTYNLSLSPIFMPEDVWISFDAGNSVEDGGFKFENTWKPQQNTRVKFGYQHTRVDLGVNFRQFEFGEANEDRQEFTHRLHTLFGEYHLSLADILEFDLGLRYQRETEIQNDYFEPRIALSAKLHEHLKLKFSSSKQFQFVSQLVLLDLNDILFGNRIWIASNGVTIPVIESNQWAGGFLFSKNGWSVDLEGYVRELAGITTLSNSFGEIPEQPFTKGNSRIRGIDVLVKKKFNEKYRSWLSYTLSQAVYEFPDINQSAFPATHDRTHQLQWVHLYKIKNFEFAAGWQFGTGLPFTSALGIDTINTPNPNIIYGDQNANRLPSYHRLDASVNYTFNLKRKGKGFLGISFINIYNHENIIGKQFLVEAIDPDVAPELLEIQELGLRYTPNFSFRLEW